MLDVVWGHCMLRLRRPASATLRIGPYFERTWTIGKEPEPVDITIGGLQSVTLRVTAHDRAKLETAFNPTWKVADPTIIELNLEHGGFAAVAKAATPPKAGTTTVTVTSADDDTLTPFIYNITVAPGKAAQIIGSADDPVEKTS